MRTLALLLALALVTSGSLAQTWGSSIGTGLVISSTAKYESAVDYQGVHFLYWDAGTLKYALFTPSGSVVRSDVTIDNSIGNYASISAVSGKLIAVYIKAPYLQAAYSTNAGATWIVSNQTYNAGYAVSGLATASDQRGVHATWNTSSSKAYYIRYTPNDAWADYKDVTDDGQSAFQSYTPTVTTSSDRAHVGYVSGHPRTRDYVSFSSWDPSQDAYSGLLTCAGTRLAVAGSSLNDVHQEWDPNVETYGRIKHSARPLSSSTWTQYSMTQDYCAHGTPFYTSATADGKVHILYSGKTDGGTLITAHRYFDGSSWSGYVKSDFSFYQKTASFKGNGNDLYVVNLHPVYYGLVCLQRYDASPTTPQNFAVSIYSNGGYAYPHLTWTAAPELDVASGGHILVERRTNPLRMGWGAWSTVATLAGTASDYIDYDIIHACTDQGCPDQVQYRIRAQDQAQNLSSYSSSVTITGYNVPHKEMAYGPLTQAPSQFALTGSYPNPFNPSTTIRYTLARAGHVQLTIYNAVGQEVARLVDEYQEASYYGVVFHGERLASGIYYARLRVTDQLNRELFQGTSRLVMTK